MKLTPAVGIRLACAAFTSLALVTSVSAQDEIIWEAYNDYRPGDATDPNVSDWDLRVTDDGGPLRDFATGDDLEAEVLVVSDGGTADDFGANSYFDPDTPAEIFFRDKVDTGNEGLPGLRGLWRGAADPAL